jgi:hypothetical protein
MAWNPSLERRQGQIGSQCSSSSIAARRHDRERSDASEAVEKRKKTRSTA